MRSEATREREFVVVTIREVKYREVHFEKAGVGRVAVWIIVVSHGNSGCPGNGIKQERVKVV